MGGESAVSLLNFCEMYSLARNQWMALPSLNIERGWPGSVLLKSKTAFCFCENNKHEPSNSVESLRISYTGWKMLPIESRIASIFHLAGVSVFN